MREGGEIEVTVPPLADEDDNDDRERQNNGDQDNHQLHHPEKNRK